MSCVLRIEGENFKVHEFIAKSNLKPYMAYTKGEKLGFVRRGIDYHELNGCAFDLSMADFDNFDLQKKDTIEFLEKNFIFFILFSYADFAFFPKSNSVSASSTNLLNSLLTVSGFISDNFKIRFRYFLGLNIPLSKKEMGAKTWYASLYNEIFMHTTSTLFDRNRVYGAIGYQVGPSIKLELGLMQQIQQNKSRTQFQLVVFNNLPL